MNQTTAHDADTVVLVHGLIEPRIIMRPLQRRLEARGYATLNFGYPSCSGPIESLAGRLRERVDQLESEPGGGRLHFVGHSLGCILVRLLIQQRRPARLGRVVMLAPPNHGSPLASRFGRMLGWAAPAIDQLSDRPDSYVNRLPPAPNDVEVGVLAASADLLVPRSSTHLDGECDHQVIRGLHLTIVLKNEAAELSDRFLRHGAFASTAPLRNNP